MSEPVMNVLDSRAAGDGLSSAGYDHPWYSWNPMPRRGKLSWPGGAAVAISVVLNLGAVEWERGEKALVPPPGGRGIVPYPDFPRMSHREFGHRVGVFRILEIADMLEIPIAAAVDVLTAERYRPLVEHLRATVAEFIAAGLSASRPVTSAMTAPEERDYLECSMQRLQAALGIRPAGWLGPEHSESFRTPRLLSELGLDYVADWCNDDQPYRLTGAGENLWAFPLSWELCDLNVMFLRGVAPHAYGTSLMEALDVLCAEAEQSSRGRMLGLHLHPWVSGQAFRAGEVAAAMAAISADDRVWMASPAEIVRWCREAR